eukprot:SAG25_NODE_2395_length_1654_cov_1.477170_1_plen_282_part_10
MIDAVDNRTPTSQSASNIARLAHDRTTAPHLLTAPAPARTSVTPPSPAAAACGAEGPGSSSSASSSAASRASGAGGTRTPEAAPVADTGANADSESIASILAVSRTRMLCAVDIRTLILCSETFSERPHVGTPDWAIYKEMPKQRRRAKKSDRWANSGGKRGSRDLPYNSPTPFIRRRYGSVFPVPQGPTDKPKGKRYYEYTLLRPAADGTIEEDKTRTLFHILPSPGDTDRGRKHTLGGSPTASSSSSSSTSKLEGKVAPRQTTPPSCAAATVTMPSLSHQ